MTLHALLDRATCARTVVIRATVICGVLAVSAVSGFAQTDTGLRREQHSHSSLLVTRVYAAAHGNLYEGVTLAPNLTVTPLYQPTVQDMLRRSPTFRRQCARIASAVGLMVDVRSEPSRSTAAAWTTIRRPSDDVMHASVIVTPVGRTAELIAHELEHVIEQLDGVNLKQKASIHASGVRHCACGAEETFETTRAIATGLRVAREVGERHD
jgi:hypothetical protein